MTTKEQPMVTLSEEDPTLASVMRRLAEIGWKAIPDTALWWTLDDVATVLTLNKCNETAIELTAIITFAPEERMMGSGSKTLRAFLSVLDELGLGCYLRVVSPGNWCGFRPRLENALKKSSLKAWYRRHGFTSVPMVDAVGSVVDRPFAKDAMYRAPSSVPQAQTT